MNQLIPCPGCNRHVRQNEAACPFCSAELSLAHVPPPALPRARLGRAATFAFGATLAGATALVGCGGDSEEGKQGGGGTAGASTSGGANPQAGNASGGSSAGQGGGGNGTVGPVYGAPAAGTGGDGSFGGGAMALYGAVPAGGAPDFD
jgi:hypothetical protein